jgi:hypothetical protein
LKTHYFEKQQKCYIKQQTFLFEVLRFKKLRSSNTFFLKEARIEFFAANQKQKCVFDCKTIA